VIDVFKNGIDFIIVPLNVFWSLLIIAFIILKKNPKFAKALCITAVIWIFITGTKFLPDLLVYGLERQYKTLEVDSALFGLPILVLGGGAIYDINIPEQDRLIPASLSRLNEGIRLFYALDRPALIFSGYSLKKNISLGEITKEAAVNLGIPNEKIIVLNEPTTTAEEAISFKKYFGNKSNTFILVTSDVHMPRAMYLFRKAGLNPIPAPTDHILRFQSKYITKDSGTNKNLSIFTWWNSNKNNFDKYSSAMHEYIGLLWARF
jgi:uncharacterized SAM-binding protein YcdF (DUF218 family)